MHNTIGMNEYYAAMRDEMKNAFRSENIVQAEYCAMHLIMTVEASACRENVNGIRFENLIVDRTDYELAEKLLKDELDTFRKSDKKSLFIVILLEGMIFSVTFAGLGVSQIISIAFIAAIVAAEIFFNHLTFSVRLNKWKEKRYAKNVNPDLLVYNNRWLKA